MTLLGPFWWDWGNNSSKHWQTEGKVWPQVALIVVKKLFKGFWKPQIFTETRRTQGFSFCSDFDPNLLPEDSHDQK